MNVKISSELRDDYEDFLVEIPILLEDLWGLMGSRPRFLTVEQGYSSRALQSVEEFFVDVMSGKELVAVSKKRLSRMFLAYIGEAVIARVGGEWELNETQGDAAFGTPCVVNWCEGGLAICPVLRRDMLLEDRRPFLVEMIEYMANKDEIERNLFEGLD